MMTAQVFRGVPLYRARIGRLAIDTAACLVLSLVLVFSLLASAFAQEAASGDKAPSDKAPPIKLQLNRLEAANEACRATLVVDNGRGAALKSYKLDLFAFDTEGVAQKRVSIEFGPIPARKTTVKIFDFPGIACPKMGRVLLNDVLACEGPEGGREVCLERTETESKTSVPFDR